MAKYKVNAVSFINGSLVKEGEVIEFDDVTGKPGPHMELVDAPKPEAKGKKAAATESLV